MWDVASGAELAVLRGHTQEVTRVAVTPNGRKVTSTDLMGRTLHWDLEPLATPASVSLPSAVVSFGIARGAPVDVLNFQFRAAEPDESLRRGVLVVVVFRHAYPNEPKLR